VRKFFLAFIIVWVLILSSFIGIAQSQSVDEIIKKADAAYAENYASEARLREAIALYEQALTIDAKHRHALNQLSQAYHELAFGYLFIFSVDRAKTNDAQKAAYVKSMEYGLRSLRLNQTFATHEKEKFDVAVQSSNDVAALSWTANSWGRIVQAEALSNPIGSLEGANKIKLMYERTIVLDEKYFAGQPRRGYGALLANLLPIQGGDLNKAKENIERALQMAPDFLETHIVYAREYALKANDKKLAEKELQFVLDAPEGERFRLWNRIAKKEAQELLDQLK
jgi:tetratricopeptide (TPR) repeat protein